VASISVVSCGGGHLCLCCLCRQLQLPPIYGHCEA
jgi:hypothetical protein